MNRIKPNDVSHKDERDSSATAGDDHGYASSIGKSLKNLINQIKPNNPSHKSAPADDTTDGHSYKYKWGKNSSGNQIKPNHPSNRSYPYDHSGASDKSGYNNSSSWSGFMNKIKPNKISSKNRMDTGASSSSSRNSFMDLIGGFFSKK